MSWDEPGHRSVRRGADLVVEAWAPTRAECLVQAACALVESFADASTVVTTDTLPVHLPPADDDALLVSVLEEVLHLVTVLDLVPVNVALGPTDDGGLAGTFDVAPVSAVRRIGQPPGAILGAEVERGQEDGLWRCRGLLAP